MDRPNDGIRFMEQALLGALFLLFIGALLFGVLSLALLDSPAAPQPAVTGNGSTPSSPGPAVAALSHPIPWTAVVVQSGPGIEHPKPRLYAPKEKP